MVNIIHFFIRFKNTLLFLFLLAIALFLTIQSHSYQKSLFLSSTNKISGNIYSWKTDVSAYFHLKKNNKRLINENKRLREKGFGSPLNQKKGDSAFGDTTLFKSNYSVFPARVISNNYAELDNYILIDQGKKDSISEEDGVMTSEGIVGVIDGTSQNYARVISILNSQLSISAQLKNSDHFGTLSWDGKDPNIMQLKDVPQTAALQQGDTIITNGRSLIFPKGVPIGTIKEYELNRNKNYFEISVKLFNDMTDVGYVYVIKNNSRDEIKNMEKSDEE